METKTVAAHIKLGSRPTFKSQYISTSTDLDRSKYSRDRHGDSSQRIAKIAIAGLTYFDMTNAATLATVFPNAKDPSRNFAKASCEVVLEPKGPVPCTYV
jgi:hypothetical protein